MHGLRFQLWIMPDRQHRLHSLHQRVQHRKLHLHLPSQQVQRRRSQLCQLWRRLQHLPQHHRLQLLRQRLHPLGWFLPAQLSHRHLQRRRPVLPVLRELPQLQLQHRLPLLQHRLLPLPRFLPLQLSSRHLPLLQQSLHRLQSKLRYLLQLPNQLFELR